jgi:hypothetical protein
MNPYEPLRLPEDQWGNLSPIAAKRPLTVTILGIFYCLGGGLGIFSIAYALQAVQRVDAHLASRYWSMLGAATLLVALSLTAGIGLLCSQRWG